MWGYSSSERMFQSVNVYHVSECQRLLCAMVLESVFHLRVKFQNMYGVVYDMLVDMLMHVYHVQTSLQNVYCVCV